MANWFKRLVLALLAWAVPHTATVSAPAALGTVAAASAPMVTPAALAGATAILAALAEEPDAATITALSFPSNGVSGGDIRLVWDGANLLPREEHTAIWRYNPVQQSGFYAVAWHSVNTGSWDGGEYSWGTHPYPDANGTVDAGGRRQNGTGSVGAVHYWEQAGLGIADDFLTSPGGTNGLLVVKDHWYVQVRKVRIVPSGADSGLMEHIFIPDLIGNPSFVIRQFFYSLNDNPPIAEVGVYPGPAGSTPAFYFGASDWTASGTANDETPSGKLRGIQLYDAWLADADVALEAANTSNTPVTVAGIANVWYMNQNPTPTDVTDKSGAGHNPTWANANRPTEWDSTVADPVGSHGRMLTLGVGP